MRSVAGLKKSSETLSIWLLRLDEVTSTNLWWCMVASEYGCVISVYFVCLLIAV